MVRFAHFNAAVTETWFTEATTHEQFHIQGYQLIRKNRPERGGGVALYIYNRYHFTAINVEDNSDIEQLWVSAEINKIKIALDKDFSERKALKQQFPDVKFLLCLSHALKAFRSAITMQAIQINSSQRDYLLKNLQRMAYANSEKDYEREDLALGQLNCPLITKYFEENWHCIKEELDVTEINAETDNLARRSSEETLTGSEPEIEQNPRHSSEETLTAEEGDSDEGATIHSSHEEPIQQIPSSERALNTYDHQKPFGQLFGDLYKQCQAPCFGIFIFDKPFLIVKDPELIKCITVKDFNRFSDRMSLSDEQCDPVSSKFLFFVKNPEWRLVRTKVSPVFSSGKIKGMVNLINEAAEEMTTYLEKNLNNDSIEIIEVCAKYATDVIATCAFGIRANCFQNENAEFRTIGKKLFDFKFMTVVRQTLYFVYPKIAQLLKLPFIDPRITEFIREVFWKTVKARENSDYKRNDLIDILIHIKRTWTEENNIKFGKFVAQAGQFYLAGFETVSSTIGFALYELCLNKNIKNKVRSDVQNALVNYGGFTFDAINNMKYLEMVIYETLRKHPVVPFLDRICSEDYKIPNSNHVIEKGTPIVIPTLGLHYDPDYFPNPNEFCPERFVDNDTETFSSLVYLPFGNGPRNCIGARFGMTVVKLGLAHILSSFEVDRSNDTPVPLKYRAGGVLCNPQQQLNVPEDVKLNILVEVPENPHSSTQALDANSNVS
ncbi:hypothetical protein ILUMI_26861 [Ignelater luminosus]|uniref:Cytochrome P450 n=1 Tax=Ignelater luminosus TaxID=2038154 RepID=A0A8K0C629_IGNLU|nr:hypothetical protein ILUMI_26861 [Ignelater luminosus]